MPYDDNMFIIVINGEIMVHHGCRTQRLCVFLQRDHKVLNLLSLLEDRWTGQDRTAVLQYRTAVLQYRTGQLAYSARQLLIVQDSWVIVQDRTAVLQYRTGCSSGLIRRVQISGESLSDHHTVLMVQYSRFKMVYCHKSNSWQLNSSLRLLPQCNIKKQQETQVSVET